MKKPSRGRGKNRHGDMSGGQNTPMSDANNVMGESGDGAFAQVASRARTVSVSQAAASSGPGRKRGPAATNRMMDDKDPAGKLMKDDSSVEAELPITDSAEP